MQLLFSIAFLIITTGLILWWSLFDVPLALSPEKTSESVENTSLENTITLPINSATEAKQRIEANNPFALDLSGQDLTTVPKSVFEKVDLESLNLSHNKLTGALPAEIRNLQNLTNLDLSANSFTGVPAEIGQLKNLEILNLSNNKLTGLPYELGNLSSLRILNLSGNNYAEADLAKIKESLPKTTSIITN
ncbi:MAG: leucine-rich repeat domain-containing protein [Minisyncoccia bacterium]